MAAAVIEFPLGLVGLTGGTVSLFSVASLNPVAAASGIAMTEGTTDTGVYSGTTAAAALVGTHKAKFFNSGGALLGFGYVVMDDTVSIHRVVDAPAVSDKTGLLNNTNTRQWLGVVPLVLSAQQVQAVVPITQQVDLNTIKTQAVTAASGVTVLASVGTADTNTAQTGDSFARIGANGSGLTALATAANLQLVDDLVDDLETRLTAARAGYLDNLNVGGAVASQADINSLNQSASRRVLLVTVPQYERPESGTNSYTVEARLFDGDGASVNADSTPTLTATGIVSGSLAANLSAASNPATGVYRWAYSETSAAALEQIRIDLSATISASAFTLSAYTQSADFIAATWTTTDRMNLTAVFNKLPSRSFLTGATSPTGSLVETDIVTPISTADDATLAAIAAMNNLSSAQVTAAVPTVTAIQSGLATAANQTTISNNVLAIPAAITTDHGSGSYVRNTEPTTPPTVAQIDSQLSITHGAGAWGGSTVGGEFAVTFTITDSVSAAPIQNATVKLTRTGEIATGVSNSSGEVVLYVSAATFTRTVSANGYTTAGATQIVTAAAAIPLTLVASSITPSDAPETTGYGRIRYAGAAVVGAVVEVEITRWANGTTGRGITPRLYIAITNASGDFEVVSLPRLATYRVRVNGADWTSAAVTLDAATTPLVAPIGPLA